MTIVNPDSFCIGPWSEVRINPDGSMNFCHAADNGSILPQDNISRISVDQYFKHSATVTAARDALDRGLRLDRCHRCYKDERVGLVSHRQRRNLQAAIFPGDDFVPSTVEALPRIQNWTNPRFYHVSLGNLCNMACMMCDPRWSSLLTTVQLRAGIVSQPVRVLQDWTQDAAVWDKFVQHLLLNDQIVCLHFMGGEPMYHKRFWQLIDVLIEHAHCDFALTVVTNGSVYAADLMKKLQRFRSVVIEISIESLHSSNDYIRYPSRYQDITHNILRYLGHRNDDFDVVLRSVPQLLSATGYHTLLQFALDNEVVIDSNVLHAPSWLALNVLPDPIKQQVSDQLEPFALATAASPRDINLRDASHIQSNLSRHTHKVLEQLHMPCEDQADQWRILVDYCARMDRARSLDVTQMIPELADYFLQAGYGR